MRILVIADVHGKFEVLQKIMDAAEKEKFDLIINPGDFTDMFDIPPNFSQLDVADIVIQKLLIPNKPLLCVPGNHDPYEILEVFDEYGINLHERTRKEAGMSFVGWGGAITPFNTLFEPREEETRDALAKALKKITGDWVLVVHTPPKNTTLDLVKPKKHVGSGAVRDVIVKKKPTLAISAHIHENKGTDKIGETTVFYPGPAYQGFYGLVTVDKKKVSCETKKVSV
jgi:Icc-related predicted phosphoesterase